MKTELTWKDSIAIPERDDDSSAPVYGIVYSPDGSQMIAGMGRNVVMYDAVTGSVTKRLKGHKDTVYCLAYAKNGERFASGGADCNVIIWSSAGEGKLKYTHDDTIQSLAFNPITGQLASCTKRDFGLWSPAAMDVKKYTMQTRILCSSWTNDGQHIAFGMYDGSICIQNNQGRERVVINRNAPVWALSWNPSRDEDNVLAVGCWDQTLSFYHISGKQLGRDRNLEMDPLSIAYFSNGEYMCIGGNDNSVSLWTKDGVKLLNICQTENWCWAVSQRPNQNYVSVGTNDGQVCTYKLNFDTVHGLYHDMYAYRDYMKDVVLQNLVTDHKVRIRCRDYIKKIAVYQNLLLVQFSNRIHVYDIIMDDDSDQLSYQAQSPIMKDLQCTLMLATSNRIVLCHEYTIELYDLQGIKEREWAMDSVIRYVKVIGGSEGKESILVALKNGKVFMIFVDNPFPIDLIRMNNSIRCVDINSNRRKLAIVDDQSTCSVYDLKNKKFLFQESGAASVSWNSGHEDMLAFSGNGMINIKTDMFPVHRQKIAGHVIGFRGSTVYCLNMVSVNTVSIPQSASMHRYLEKRDFDGAYRVACLGVTEKDWKDLSLEALLDMRFDISRKGFIRIRDIKYLRLLDKFEQLERQNHNFNEFEYKAEIMAYQGAYEAAAKMYVEAHRPDIAIDMLCDLRMFDEAKRLASGLENVNINDLILRQAKSAEDDNDWHSACEMYVIAGKFELAIPIMEKNGWFDMVMDLCNRLSPETDTATLRACAQTLYNHGKRKFAREVYQRLKDYESLVRLYVDAQMWDEAFSLANDHPELNKEVYVPFAEYLAMNDQFDLAQKAFKRAKRPQEALKLIEILANNASVERRFGDTSFYFFELALENLYSHVDVEDSPAFLDRVRLFEEYSTLSKVYYAYEKIHRYAELPFRETEYIHLLGMAIFILNCTNTRDIPQGISRVKTFIALGRLSTILGAFKLARETYQKLQTLMIPIHLRDEVDLARISINGKPMVNDEKLVPICYRCSATNPFLISHGDRCNNCQHPFVRSSFSFDVLPLVEFELASDISEAEARKLIEYDPVSSQNQGRGRYMEESGVESMQIDMGYSNTSDSDMNDTFNRILLSTDFSVQGERYSPVRIDRETLKELRKEEVYIVRYSTSKMRPRYYKNVYPKKSIAQCRHCNSFFDDNFEFETLKCGGNCPFCRKSQDDEKTRQK